MGTQNIKAQVHLVATKENRKDNTIYLSPFNHLIHSHTSAPDYVPQHLYFTTDEEIKDGNLYLSDVNNAVCKWTQHYSATNGYGRKIVATTNPELWGRLCGASDGQFTESNGNRASKFVGNPELIENSGCAKIDTPFIEAFIKAYNEGNPIKEVLLETQYKQHSSGLYHDPMQSELKLRPNGSVIIHPIKERMFTMREMVDFAIWLTNYSQQHIVNQYNHYVLGDDAVKPKEYDFS